MSNAPGIGNLLEKTAGGTGWTVGWRAVTRGLGFVSTLVLARILVPADFGLVALAMSFSRGIDILADLGVQDALIRQPNPNRNAYDTAFTINAIRGLITATIITASAYPFAVFFGEPRLTNVVHALALAVVLDALENIGVSDFRRHMMFRREFQLTIYPRLAQVIVTIAFALVWKNYWALVAGILTARIMQTTASYIMHPYRPRLSLRGWHDIFAFSFWTWLIGMARMIRGRAVTMIVGGILNPTMLGIYTVGAEIATLPETELIAPLCRVCFASFAAANRSNVNVAETYLRIVASALIIALPASIGISSIAAPLVTLAFGAKWIEATPIIQILAAAGVFTVIGRISLTLFSAFAYLRSLFWIAVVMSAVQCALLVPFVWYDGIIGAAIAVALATLVEQAIYAVIAFHRFAIRPFGLIRLCWRCLSASAVMIAYLLIADLGWTDGAEKLDSSAHQLLLTAGTGAIVYTIVLLGLWLASGRPAGPETDMLAIVRRSTARLVAQLSRRAAPT
jgi:lipopolysaccharide exporter